MIRALLVSLVTFVALGLVTVWAVARPGSALDWPGRLGAQAAPHAERIAGWYEGGPADGRPDWAAQSMAVLNGDAEAGRAVIASHGCGTCHEIPGVPRAHGSVGPSLAGLRDRSYIAGVLSNRPGELIDWLMEPPAFSPMTAMPDLGLTEAEARDVAAFLYTLRD
jgi:cytochrome c2